ncbi:MAG: co-chaperone YbbN [Gordonia sp.]|uniref:Tetratricopeptide repeat protein n=1 Tax=Gordonia rubripertincta TaxID=36822 RepID=A0ABT4MWU1_GORRU|nr:tetratricopeptide repeat protein [Gordonia rubripertincta]MBA4025669.1 co-chaperone YbbN [Gordonia sp. (in: high G+C Gram-positive bacteria)]MCZ4550207.1 tetratricopeptide repeat protein [Gordonia rubripertincta]
MSGAVDLSVLKERADAGRAQANRPAAPTPPAGRAPAPSGGAFPAVYDVTEADFEADVVARSDQVLVLVDLWATWCEPCKQLSPTLEALAAQSGGKWVLAKVDVDANPRIAQLFGVQSIPTVVAIVAGQPVSAFAGVQPAGQIQGWIDDILVKHGGELTGAPAADGAEPEPEPEDPRMIAAENKLNDGDIDGALADYKEIAAAEPGNVEAASLVRNLEFVARAQKHDAATLADAAPDDVPAQLAAADLELLNQQPEAAFDRIIKVISRTAGDERTEARTRLLELFELFDPAETFVVAARRKLATALY